jgi:hypothetical protein
MTAPSPEPQTILFLASNPDGLRQVGRKLREIKEGLRRSRERDNFVLNLCLDVRTRDKKVKVLELQTGREVLNFTAEDSLLSCAISPEDQTVVTSHFGGQIYFLRMEGNRFRKRGPDR